MILEGNSHGQQNIETPGPICRPYWCLIEFIDWRVEIQSVMTGIFDQICELLSLLPSLWLALPPLPPFPV